MKFALASVVLACTVSGCAHYESSLPADYTGPKAFIEDTSKIHSSRHAELFFLTHVDGREIQDSRSKTLGRNRGRGFMMDAVTSVNPVPAHPVVLTLKARTLYAAPILELMNDIYQVSGEVTFTPIEGKTYQVKGQLGEGYSAVWLEDSESHAVVGEKLEAKGSAKLGFMQK
ncbi:MAG: hypothetical protein AB1899_06195 [Pseudomonadota bacterium]